MLVRSRERARTIDPRCFLFAERVDALRAEVAEELVRAIEQALGAVAQLESCSMGGAAVELQLDGDWNDPLTRDRDWGDLTTPPPAGVVDLLGDNLAQHVNDVCFAVGSELRGARRKIEAAWQRHEELLIACESARRKMERCLSALLDAVAQLTGSTAPGGDVRHSEVAGAIAVRRLYAKFRASIVRYEGLDPRAIRRALRYAAVSLAVVIGSSDFGEVRLSDRLMFLSLQRRILLWARGQAEPTEGARLCRDIESAADLLRAINLRQELQVHDAELLASVPPRLASGLDDAALRVEVGRLAALRGRDDELDALLASAFAGQPVADLGARLLAIVGRLAGELRHANGA